MRAVGLAIWGMTMLGMLLVGCGQAPEPASPDAGTPSEPVSGIAFVSERDGNQEIYLVQPDGGDLTRLTNHAEIDADPAWSPDGTQIVFRSRRDGSSDLFVMKPDGTGLRNLILDPRDSEYDEFAPAWAPDGETLALITDRFPMGTCSPHQVALMSATGGVETMHPLDAGEGNQRTVAWSPDGRRLAFSSHCLSADVNLYVWDLQTRSRNTLTDNPAVDSYPAWSPDGRFLAFQSTRDGNAEIYLLELATGGLANLTRHPATDTQPTWSPDGAQIAFTSTRDGNYEIYLMQADGSAPRNLTQHPARDFWPSWSPVP